MSGDFRLVVMFACIAAVLIVNTATLFAAYKIFDGIVSRTGKRLSDLRSSIPSRQWLASAQTASEEAVRISGLLKDRVREADPQLACVAKNYSNSLAQTDGWLKLGFGAFNVATAVLAGAVTWPLKRWSTSMSLLEGALAYIRRSENGADARPRRNE